MEWWMFRSFALKERPANTGETVMVCPLGRWTTLGAMVGNFIYSTSHEHVRQKNECMVVGRQDYLPAPPPRIVIVKTSPTVCQNSIWENGTKEIHFQTQKELGFS